MSYFSPPPLEEPDFKKDSSFEQWSKFIGDQMNYVINLEEETVGVGKSQFYNPESTPAEADKQQTDVTWNAFPRRIKAECPDNYYEVADKKDGWSDPTKARNQDEYLEWYVYKNDEGKITRIDFTCEGPEYWESLFNWEPDTCLDLYKKHISDDVKMEDLYEIRTEEKTTIKSYKVYNKWNTTDGCMHLNCPPNTLGAEIQLAGDASIIREKNGEIITDSDELIRCSKYGRPSRNSDPHIGSACNNLCQSGKRITLANPTCLFIANVYTSGWTTPDGEDASKYMTQVRGIKGKGLRYSLKVPDSEGFTVSDIKIGGAPITYGGQIAELMDVGLTAEYCTNNTGAQRPHPCPCSDQKADSSTPNQPLTKATRY